MASATGRSSSSTPIPIFRSRQPADIFTLASRDTANFKKLKDKEGFGAQSVAKLFAAIEDRRSPPLNRFIFGLGIRHIGENTARLLARHYGSFDLLRRAVMAAEQPDAPERQELDAIDGVGPTVVEVAAGVLRGGA